MKLERILLATDFSDTSKKAIALARQLKDGLDAEIHLLHVFDREAFDMPLPYGLMPGATTWSADHVDKIKKAAQKSLDDVRLQLGECHGHFVEGRPGHEICAFADKHDCNLIILGTHGYKGFQRVLMGSVAEYVLRHSTIPVLTIKAEE